MKIDERSTSTQKKKINCRAIVRHKLSSKEKTVNNWQTPFQYQKHNTIMGSIVNV